MNLQIYHHGHIQLCESSLAASGCWPVSQYWLGHIHLVCIKDGGIWGFTDLITVQPHYYHHLPQHYLKQIPHIFVIHKNRQQNMRIYSYHACKSVYLSALLQFFLCPWVLSLKGQNFIIRTKCSSVISALTILTVWYVPEILNNKK